MTKEEIIEVLTDWNFWIKDIDIGIYRENYLKKLVEFIHTDKVISIVGVRRSGKSTLIKQIAKRLIGKGMPRTDILIVNFEEPQFLNADLNLLVKIYHSYREIIKPQKKPFIFLDEIQTVKNWEKFVRSINEKKEAYVLISGSSSKLLSEELATILTGRQLYFQVLPLSFEEFLSFKNLKKTNKKELLLNAEVIRKFFYEYFQWGGFPEVVLNPNEEFKRRTLVSYYEDIINRDIVQRFKIKKIDQLKALVRFYLTNISSYITFNSSAKFIKLPVETVRRFSSYVETSNLVFLIKRFSFSVKEQENSARKVYSIDTGLSNAIGFKFSKDFGRIAENIVALKLRSLQILSPLIEVYYWKNTYGSKEVDFILKDVEIKKLIQVCWDISDERTKKRQIDALLKAMEEFKQKSALIITEDTDGEEKIKNKIIVFTPLWKWLLDWQKLKS